MTGADDRFVDIVRRVAVRVFGETPGRIERMGAGLANEVYAVSLAGRDVIVRLNENPDVMRGAEAHIALFRGLGIAVPEVLAADYSMASTPFAYQVQTRTPGADIGRVITTLSRLQLTGIAQEVAAIVAKLAPLPTDGRFGWAGGAVEPAYDTWPGLLRDMRRRIAERGATTRTIGARQLQVFDQLFEAHGRYFEAVRSVFYFDDMSSKNVMVSDGRFAGLVDLDNVAYGDPLEGIGRIEASWYGTDFGRGYADGVMHALGLDVEQRRMVLVYAVLNRIQWLSEHGVKFNANTTAVVDPALVERDRAVIEAMVARLKA
jgi:aminoglycoside phosphotransferase (APT) family kinase protein